MGRKRTSNPLNLPPRVYAKHGAFYYHHLPTAEHRSGRWERLGTDIEIVKRRARDIEAGMSGNFGTVDYWMGQFLQACRERVKAGDLAPRTLADYERDSEEVLDMFGKMFPAGLEAHHKAVYLDEALADNRPVRGNREFAVLSAMMSWLVRTNQAGVKSNPFLRSGIKRNKETKRERYVEHDEMRKALEHAPVQVWALAHLVYRTLQRPEDIITWTMRNIIERRSADGRLVKIIRNDQGKTGKIVDIEITHEIEAIFKRLNSMETKLRGMTLIHRRDGHPYTYDGLAAMLKRRQKDAGVASFGYYDLKGKGATDMWLSGVPLELIQVLCGHESVTTTERYVKSRWRGVVTPNQVAAAV
jgi:integrase